MKSAIMVVLLFALMACSSQNHVEAPPINVSSLKPATGYGHDLGNGSDTHDIGDHSAWFLGSRTIRYCASIDSSFGTDSASITANLRLAFAQWRDYILAKKVNETLRQLYENPHINNVLPFSPLATNSQFLEECDGSEDIKFYFGGMSDEVSASRQQFRNPWAFNIRRSYDPKTGWGKGFVWVAPQGSVYPEQSAPNWSMPSSLLGVLLHEIGHIYGNEHVPGTIMTANMELRGEAWGNNEEWTSWSLSRIDNERELFQPIFSQPVPLIAGYISPKPIDPDGRNATLRSDLQTFLVLTGDQADGAIMVTRESGFLTFSDAHRSLKLPFEIYDSGDADGTSVSLGGAVFSFSLGTTELSLTSRRDSKYGVIHAADGTKLTVEEELNDYGRLQMYYFMNGSRFHLFSPKQLTSSGWQ